MVKEELDQRSQGILMTLVRAYIAKGEPVGSETLQRLSRLGLSAATIRNILARLEDEGYLFQPHTSAGRVPTDLGYRTFVDALPGGAKIKATDVDLIRSLFIRDFEGPAQPLERVSHLLAELTNHVGVVVASNVARNALQHIEFVRLSARRILVILVTRPGIVQNRLLVLQESFTQSELDRTAQYLMAKFPGKSLVAIRAELQQRLREERVHYDTLLENALLLCQQRELSDESTAAEVFVDGASKMVNEATLQEVARLKGLLEALEEKSKVLRLLNECLKARDVGIQVLIGSENSESELQHCALITAPYRVSGQVMGTLGIIGPRRMSYNRTISLVDYMAKMVSQMLSAN